MGSGSVDVVIDELGLWTTVRGTGPGTLRPVPEPSGISRKRLWPLAVDDMFAQWLANALANDPTPRTTALARVTVATIKACDERAVPFFHDQRWMWMPSPGPAGREEVDGAVATAVAAGLVTCDDAPQTLQSLIRDIATQRLATVTTDAPRAPTPAESGAIRRWSEQVRLRAAVNARLTVVLTPPSETAPLWTLHLMAVHTEEATTRLPWATADPALFRASESAWQQFVAFEIEAMSRAWGRRLPSLLAELTSGSTAVTDDEVLEFVDDVAQRLQDAGFDVVAPGGLLKISGVKRRVSRTGSTGTGTLSIESLGLQAEVTVDGQTLSAEELTALAASKSELVSVRGRWMRIDSRDAQRLAALAKRLRRAVTPADLLADEAFEGVELDAGDILPRGLAPARRPEVPQEVKATLRPYQVKGLEWLTWLADNQIGGVLADDMGLGKTLQVLTLIQADHSGPTLVVCPVTLVDTWARQAAEFTPGLRVQAFHGSERGDLDADIVVTTYGLLARDQRLVESQWHRVVLDEAQAIKNPDTLAARAARALSATHRLAVTGTPVENHLGDLWSLFAFAHPGLLPRRKAFSNRYSMAAPEDLSRLRAVVGPFILRRVKTDPGILPDLPDRQVIRDDCTMTREQVGAYEAVVADMLGTLEELRQAAGSADDPRLRRRAEVLAGISRLKQICVHPALLTESRKALGDRSGKISRLVELCGQIVDEGQALVIFTQFASFVPDLADHLSKSLGVGVATLTGADSRTKRAETVSAFSAQDGPPILIASLKAGGTGLTLVRANHVIHLDRWWNPAVEDQASDRVWRIGQKQKVSVHVLVCPGTLEDRIDQALRSKRALASSVIRSTETAVTELSDAELTALIGLVRAEVLQ